jgi:uncharacterized protein
MESWTANLNPNIMNEEIKHKESDRRGMFYMEDEKGIISELTYSIQDNGIMVIDHTETRQELEGRGLASRLVRKVWSLLVRII